MGVRRIAPALIIVLLAGAACAGGSSEGRTHVTIVVHGMNMGSPWHTTSTLRCAPAGGTHRRAATACRALAALLRNGAVPPRHCAHETSGPWTTVRGTYRGHTISLAYAEACAASARAGIEAQQLGDFFAHG
jgi:hypothetical protein